MKTQELADNPDLPSDNDENNHDNDQQDQAAQDQSEADNDNHDNDNEESSAEEQIVDQRQDLKPQVEHQTEQILDQQGQESIDRQLQEEIAGTSTIDKGKEGQIQFEPLQRKDPYQKRLEKANSQAALENVFSSFFQR